MIVVLDVFHNSYEIRLCEDRVVDDILNYNVEESENRKNSAFEFVQILFWNAYVLAVKLDF